MEMPLADARIDKGFKIFRPDLRLLRCRHRCTGRKGNTLPADIVELNKKAFIWAIKKFRAKNPDILFYRLQWLWGGDMVDTVLAPF